MEYLEGKKVMYNNEECVVVACERGIGFTVMDKEKKRYLLCFKCGKKSTYYDEVMFDEFEKMVNNGEIFVSNLRSAVIHQIGKNIKVGYFPSAETCAFT